MQKGILPQLFDLKKKNWYQRMGLIQGRDQQPIFALSSDLFVSRESEAYNQEKDQVALKLLFNAMRNLIRGSGETSSGIYKSGELVRLQTPGQASLASQTIRLQSPGGNLQTLPGKTQAFIGEEVGIYQASFSATKQAPYSSEFIRPGYFFYTKSSGRRR